MMTTIRISFNAAARQKWIDDYMDESERFRQAASTPGIGHGAGAVTGKPPGQLDPNAGFEECAKTPYETQARTRRLTARDEIRELQAIYSLRINQLEALSRALPADIPFVADEGLRSLLAREKTSLLYFS